MGCENNNNVTNDQLLEYRRQLKKRNHFGSLYPYWFGIINSVCQVEYSFPKESLYYTENDYFCCLAAIKKQNYIYIVKSIKMIYCLLLLVFLSPLIIRCSPIIQRHETSQAVVRIDALTGESRVTSMESFLLQRAKNNTLLLMIVDYGYLNMWNNSYLASHLEEYDNLVVFCMDTLSYNARTEEMNNT